VLPSTFLYGGAISELVMRNPSNKKLQIINHLSDSRQRVVANVPGRC
jgi:hypothetical protein